jgi:hypothetical protein
LIVLGWQIPHYEIKKEKEKEERNNFATEILITNMSV